MKKTSLLCSLLPFLLPALVWAQASQYGASLHESSWNTTSSRLECTLSHEIPMFGKALFVRLAGEPLGFTLQSQLRVAGEEANLTFRPPAWRHDLADVQGEPIPLERRGAMLALQQGQAKRLLDELESGLLAIFSYLDVGGKARLEVSLSPVQLQRPLRDFQGCVAELLPFNFDQVKTSRVHFSSESAALPLESQAFLNQLAEYLSLDGQVRRVRIEGRADNRGGSVSNYNLAKRRAEAVKQWLVDKGVAADRFVIKSYGERRPLASNKTEQGRAENRAVIITLQR
jgi:outer membrane protein OmpA-like peptidoglycan-associated protein